MFALSVPRTADCPSSSSAVPLLAAVLLGFPDYEMIFRCDNRLHIFLPSYANVMIILAQKSFPGYLDEHMQKHHSEAAHTVHTTTLYFKKVHTISSTTRHFDCNERFHLCTMFWRSENFDK